LVIAPTTGTAPVIGEAACAGIGCRVIGSIDAVTATGFTVAMSRGIGIIGIFVGIIGIIKRIRFRQAQI
jgi:hypothetical protein